jgi:hypothetical protein
MTVESSPASREFRIVCRRVNGDVGLVRLCDDLSSAVSAARGIVNKYLLKLRQNAEVERERTDRPRQVWVERWSGSGWAVVPSAQGGYSFEFWDRVRRGRRSLVQATAATSSGNGPNRQSTGQQVVAVTTHLQAGQVVRCILLPQRTRKGGWFAQVESTTLSGPVTNWQQLPVGLEPGQVVSLRVCGVRPETGFVQLAPTTDRS